MAGFLRAVTRAAVRSAVTTKLRQAERAAEQQAEKERIAREKAGLPALPQPTPSALAVRPDASALYYGGKTSLMTRFFMFLGNPLIAVLAAGVITLLGGALFMLRRFGSDDAPASPPVAVAPQRAAGFGRRGLS